MIFKESNDRDIVQSTEKTLDILFLNFSVIITKIILLIIFNLVLFYYEILIPAVIYITLVNQSYKYSIKVNMQNNESIIEKKFHENLVFEIEEDCLILRKW